MRIAGINFNDTANGEGVCVSLFLQGCPHHCKGCHNPETWAFTGGHQIEEKNLIDKIIQGITKNGILRNFSLLGGEPLCPGNVFFSKKILSLVKKTYPTIKTYLWTGYTLEQLKLLYPFIDEILCNVDVLIDGPFQLDNRDITLKLRGSTNQRILFKGIDF